MQERTFFSIFQTLFFVTGIPFALILWGMLDLPWHRAVIVAIVAGIVIGMGFAFFVRGSEVSFASDPNTDFGVRIAAMLFEMGYKKEHHFHRTTTYQPTWRSGLFADRMIVNLHDHEVMLCGPKMHVDKITRHLGV
ncbi:MAG: hypothetical protein AB7G06_06055 [Bdellovibrionales bacterium]